MESGFSILQDELKGFLRTIAEIEWLLLLLVILYFVTPGTMISHEFSIILGVASYALFVFLSNLLSTQQRSEPWLMNTKVWVMLAFISWIVWNTGKIDSPLLELYIVAVITSALILSRTTTFCMIALVLSCYLYLSYAVLSIDMFSLEFLRSFILHLAPVLIIAYLTMMLSRGIHDTQRRMTYLSEHDALTGKLNIRAFDQALEREMDRSKRYNHPLSVIMIDSDNLKGVNDTHGHKAGDNLIKLVADSIQFCLRTSDVLARYGGDEFIVLLPEIDKAGAAAAAERIRQMIQDSPLRVGEKKISTSASLGVASFPEQADNLKTLMAKADKAMYYSKLNGKNRMSLFSEDMMPAHEEALPSKLER